MGRRRLLDLDDDLKDAEQAAQHIGLTSSYAFHSYVTRFPEPAPKGLRPAIVRGRIRLWIRQDLDAFLKAHPTIARKGRDADGDPS